MTSVRGHGHLRRKRLSAAPSIIPSDSFPPFKLGDKLSNQPVGPSKIKSPVANASATATSIPKYSKDDLQQILKAVLEAQAPTPTPTLILALAPAPVLAHIVVETPWEKLKARSPDVYHDKSQMNCFNFYQQYEDYFATIGATGPTRSPFAMFFLWDRISFRWQ